MTHAEVIALCDQAIEDAKNIQAGLVESRSDLHHFQTLLTEIGNAGKVEAAVGHAAQAAHNIQLAHDRMANAIGEIRDVIGYINSI